jgi:isopenicillin-N N-acyltransferase-like protein
MVPVRFDQADPRERGRAHGELWRGEIAELAAIRLELAVRRGTFVDAAQVLRVAAAHLPELERQSPALHAELLGIAEGADLDPVRVVVLNHYTDLRDVPPEAIGERGRSDPSRPGASADPGGCTAIYCVGSEGPLLAQTWDMHASALPFVRMLHLAPRGGGPELLCFTLTGCVGMTGLASTGVGVTINNLTSTDAQVGLVWPALVRELLASPSAEAAYERLLAARLSSGHHYMIADMHSFHGVETSGTAKVRTQKGARAAHLHTNHVFDPVLRKTERVAATSTTFARMNMASTLYAQQRPKTAEALWELLASHEGGRGALCSHLDDASGDPSAATTCGVIVMRLRDGSLLASRGCELATRRELRLERFAPAPSADPSA